MIPVWVDKYMDIPFVEKGRDISGCDCWGLTRMVMAEQFDIDLPEFLVGYADTVNDRTEIAAMIDHNKALLGFSRVDKAMAGDVAVIRALGQTCHLGIMVSSVMVLHTEQPAGPRLDNIKSVRIKNRVEGFYRHE